MIEWLRPGRAVPSTLIRSRRSVAQLIAGYDARRTAGVSKWGAQMCQRGASANPSAFKALTPRPTPSSRITRVSWRSIPPKRGARRTRRPEVRLRRRECFSLMTKVELAGGTRPSMAP